MLVEHSFVTTLSEPEAMDRAALFLKRVGLRHSDVASTSKPNKKLYRGLPGDFIPRKIELGFDRGRVSAAIVIEPKRKAQPAHREVLLALVHGLERVIAAGETEDQAAQPWQDVINQERRRLRRQTLIHASVLVGIMVAFFGFIWLANAMR